MALLSSNRPARLRLRAVAVLSFAVVAGCALVQAILPGARPFSFNHKVHANEGIECADCHSGAETGDEPGMPALAGCMLCHQDIDANKPPERKVATLFDEQGYRAARSNHLDHEKLFSHQKHVQKGLECKGCHVGIEASESIAGRRTITMATCQACHAEQKVANECATCHQEIRADRKPENHAFMWQKLHGSVARAHDGTNAGKCSLCHTEDSCSTCHLEVTPDSHNNYFRRRGHGVSARMDRESCAACHRADSCDACHRDARPMSHTGSWGASVDTHCLSCHFPLTSNDCSTCHDGTPSHTTATALPSNHSPAMNCRQCHGNGQPLPHVDNGATCTSCHQ